MFPRICVMPNPRMPRVDFKWHENFFRLNQHKIIAEKRKTSVGSSRGVVVALRKLFRFSAIRKLPPQRTRLFLAAFHFATLNNTRRAREKFHFIKFSSPHDDIKAKIISQLRDVIVATDTKHSRFPLTDFPSPCLAFYCLFLYFFSFNLFSEPCLLVFPSCTHSPNKRISVFTEWSFTVFLCFFSSLSERVRFICVFSVRNFYFHPASQNNHCNPLIRLSFASALPPFCFRFLFSFLFFQRSNTANASIIPEISRLHSSTARDKLSFLPCYIGW